MNKRIEYFAFLIFIVIVAIWLIWLKKEENNHINMNKIAQVCKNRSIPLILKNNNLRKDNSWIFKKILGRAYECVREKGKLRVIYDGHAYKPRQVQIVKHVKKSVV